VGKPRKQEQLDCFFDAVNQTGVADGHEKDGEAGMLFLGQLLNLDKHPAGAHKKPSLLDSLFPWLNIVAPLRRRRQWVPCVPDARVPEYGVHMIQRLGEIESSGPGHAFNANIFVTKLKRRTRLEGGAKSITLVFS
jgi:hypothetical protein